MSLGMIMAKSERDPHGYCQNALQAAGESEGSGSSGPVDADMTASEDSSAPVRKCISLNSDKCNAFGVPTQVLSLSNMTQYERKDLINRLRKELEQIRIFQRRVESQRTNGVALSSSSDILSCSNVQNRPKVGNCQKSIARVPGQGKKLNPSSHKVRGWNRGSSGRFETVNQASAPSTASALLMKQCETLLKRLMSHNYAWIFNTPVDVVKLNIPDYYTVIKHPMDLGTIKSKLASGTYAGPLEFAADVRLTFKNAMTYNPKGHEVHVMADTLGKYFEVRWKTIEKKLPVNDPRPLPAKVRHHEDMNNDKPVPPLKKRKAASVHNEVVAGPVKRVMTDEEKHNLGRELESLLGEMPAHIIDFLREHSSNSRDSGDDEIEIDIDDLSDDTLFKLQKLLDDYLREKRNNEAKAEPCEIEMLNESGMSNSSMQQCKGNDPADEDVDIAGNDPAVSSYPHMEFEKDTIHRSSKCVSSGHSSDIESSSSDSEAEDGGASRPKDAFKEPETAGSGDQLDENKYDDLLDGHQYVSGLSQPEQTSQEKPGSIEADCQEDGNSAPVKPVSPEKRYRAALLKSRFADTILKAREKTLAQVDKGDPEKLRREREELELQRRREKARLQAEAKAAEDARRQAEAQAAAEVKRKRELEREAARQALLKMEKTVEINENSRFLEDLEMLRSGPAEHLPSSADETSPDHSQDGLVGFKLGGGNPLEQLGLYMKEDEDEEDGDHPGVPDPVNDVEEGEID